MSSNTKKRRFSTKKTNYIVTIKITVYNVWKYLSYRTWPGALKLVKNLTAGLVNLF